MGFNKRYIPSLDKLIEKREEYQSDKDFLKAVVGKSDALIGPQDSIEYLDSIYEKIKKEDEPGAKYT